MEWDLPEPFTIRFVVVPDEIDEYNHVNNAEYVRWLDRCAWAHSTALGISIEDCKRMDRGMAVRRSQFDYVAPAFLDDSIIVGTWITQNDGKVRVMRQFQVMNEATRKTLLRASIEYVCLVLTTGRPSRQPPEFLERYR